MKNYIGYYPRFNKEAGIYNIEILFDKIRAFPGLISSIYRRGYYGYSWEDVMSADTYMLKIAVRLLENLRDNQQGLMWSLLEDCRESEETAIAIQAGIYTAIIDGFSAENIEEKDWGWTDTIHEKAVNKFNLALELFLEYYIEFWK